MAKKPNGKPAMPWPADRVERWAIDRIKPYPGNPRTHSEREIELLSDAMRNRGVTTAVLVDEDGILIAGHGRLEAAKRAGLAELPVNIAVGWPEEEKRAHRIWDNQSTLLGDWSMPLLRAEMTALLAAGHSMPLLGFDDATTSWLSTGDLVLDPADEWNGMPQFSQGDARPFRSIIMHFKDQAAVDRFLKLTKLNISPTARYSWFPENKTKETMIDKRYVAR